jgi:hypothetical protein
MHRLAKKIFATLVTFWVTVAYGNVGQLSASEIEQRNAAASFASSREASLFLLLGECEGPLANTSTPIEGVVRAWSERNRPEMEATYFWLTKYFAHLKTINPALHSEESKHLTQSVGNSVLQIARISFARQLPDSESCRRAALTYSISELDIKNIGANPGYAQFAEFGRTLTRIREDSDFANRPMIKLGMENARQHIGSVGIMASLDAAEAAKERGDGLGRIAAFKSLALRGQSSAAQEIGRMYLNGNMVEKNYVSAYRWFHAAWTLSDAEGLNAMGVMLRDGLGVKANLPLAEAAFYVAVATATSQTTAKRAAENLVQLNRLAKSEETKNHVACMTLKSMDDALRDPVRELEPLVHGRVLPNSDRHLGEIVKYLSDGYRATNCQ